MKPATKLTKVTPTLFGWAAYKTDWKVYFNSYACCTPAGLILIDPTKPAAPVLKKLLALGEPAAIILTNAHHDRDADWFRKTYAIQIYANEKAPADCDSKIDVPIVDGEKLFGGLQAVFLPGVSPSEMALLGPDVLMLGDAILHTPGKGLEPMPDQFIGDKKLYRRSLQRLAELKYEIVTFGHGEPLLANGKKTIVTFLKSLAPNQSSSGKAR